MCKNIKIIRKNEYKTSTWSGGTTTELYIYPEQSNYANRDFLFRISSAKIEVDESVFTYLPGINREIMVIDGELELEHKNYYNTKLYKFDKDRFSGEWTTKSFGKVIDFNLMMNNGCDGNLEHIYIDKESSKNIDINKDKMYNKVIHIIYFVNGEASINIAKDKNIELYCGDLLVYNIDNNANIEVYNKSNEDLDIIISKVYL